MTNGLKTRCGSHILMKRRLKPSNDSNRSEIYCLWSGAGLQSGIEQAESSQRAAAMRFRRERLVTVLAEHIHTWATSIAGNTLASNAISSHRDGQREQFLETATGLLDTMTLGAYHQLLVDESTNRIVAVARDGSRTRIDEIDDEDRTLAALALQIALIRIARHWRNPPPVLVEDIVSDLVPDRAAEALRALDDLSSAHQVLIVTANPSTVALSRQVIPNVSIVGVGGQRTQGLNPAQYDHR